MPNSTGTCSPAWDACLGHPGRASSAPRYNRFRRVHPDQLFRSIVMSLSEEEFEKIVRSLKPAIFFHCWRLLGDEAEAADATDETFLRVWSNRKQADTTKGIKAWIYRIATNCCTDRMRRTWRTERLPDDELLYEIRDDKMPTPEDEAIHAEYRAALNHLSLEDRSLLLKRLEGHSLKELSTELNWSIAKVHRRYKASVETLRNTWMKHK